MKTYALSHLSDPVLLRDLATLVAHDRATTAELLAHIAEVDARKLYLPAAYPSMYAHCVGELWLSEDAAFKCIQAARVGRRFTVVFHAVADGRLHLSAIGLLAAHVTEENPGELLTAATHRTKREIEQLLAERFPQPDVLAWVAAIPVSRASHPESQLAPGQVGTGFEFVPGRVGEALQLAPGQVGTGMQLAPGHVADRSRVRPTAPQRFAVQFTMSQCAHDKLRYVQELLGAQVPSGDIAAVVEQALDALVEQLEKRKFAATSRPNCGTRRGTANPRYVPADVKRKVWERDGAQCTFASETGRRCEARSRLEFDHVLEVARGGEATVAGTRLRCRAHNQYAAECTFGTEFMRHRRISAAEARVDVKAGAPAPCTHGPSGPT